MLPPFLIAIISLLTLVALHELGHFFVAKRFKVKVEEFGIGLPPRIFGKYFGETLYSLNWLPLGAFVRLLGEEKAESDPRSFSVKPVWQRVLIVAGGVVAFWIIAAILLSFHMGLGTSILVGDEEEISDASVQIVGVVEGSPAEQAGLRMGDIIASLKLKIKNEKLKINKVNQVQEFTEQHRGQEIVLTIQRGNNVFEVELVPRVSPPEDEGAMGVALARIAIKKYPWWQAPLKGIEETFQLTAAIVMGLATIAAGVVSGRGLLEGAELMGPIGIGVLVARAVELGFSYYLRFIATISIYLAIFNALPIPAVDGGKLMFLGIEAIRKKPLPQAVEQKITAAFFLLLLTLLIFITIKDVSRLF